MSRVKRGTIHTKRRRNILKQAKGWRFGRSKKLRQAREGIYHAGEHAFTDRKKKKRDFRQLWQVKINAGTRAHDMSYSKFMHALKQAGIGLDRKMLAHIAEHNPEHFETIVKKVQSASKTTPKTPAA